MSEEKALAQKREREEHQEKEVLYQQLAERFQGKPEEVIPMLQFVQKALGYLTEEALLHIARLTRLPAAKIFGTATFYAQFRLQPIGKNMIKVCRGTACHVKGSDRILKDLEEHLQLVAGQTSSDGLFTLETVACFGSCALAPVMVVNDSVHGNTDRSKALKMIEALRTKPDASDSA
jgi:NADH-quinone oxidoreductase subunit E